MKIKQLFNPLKHDQSGVVLITVVVIVLLIMLLVTAVISLNISQAKLTQDEYKRIQNRILADSTLAFVYADQQTGTPTMTDSFAMTIGSISHNISYSISSGGILGSSIVEIDVTY